jgi:hypothetical protein
MLDIVLSIGVHLYKVVMLTVKTLLDIRHVDVYSDLLGLLFPDDRGYILILIKVINIDCIAFPMMVIMW